MKNIISFGSLLALVGYLLFPGLACAVIPTAQRQALTALYNSTDGDNWSDNSGWKTPPLDTDGFAMPGTENLWYGIKTASEDSTVLEIGLYDNQLSGSIPAEIGNLPDLSVLKLNGNQLSGSIPKELGNLKQLFDLSLYDNQLSGNVPKELGNFTILVNLDLTINQLSGSIPAELGNLTSLISLALGDNQLSGSIPAELSNLASLTDLDLRNNQLSGSIPAELGILTNLEQLSLEINQLSGSIPAKIGNLTSLKYLKLDNNQLSGSIPVQLMNLTKLIDNESDFRFNHLYTTNDDLRNFLNSKQIGGDWESYQTPPFSKAMPWMPLLLLDD